MKIIIEIQADCPDNAFVAEISCYSNNFDGKTLKQIISTAIENAQKEGGLLQ